MRDVRLLTEPLVPAPLIDKFAKAYPQSGGVCHFVGEVRGGQGIEGLELSYYRPLTLPAMQHLADAAHNRFDLLGILIAHRVGVLQVAEPIVCVSAAAPHRREAIDAVDYCMDHLKCASWFWKRERRADGWHWIEPRSDDHAAIARWNDGK